MILDSGRSGYSAASNRALGQTDYIRDTMRGFDTMKTAMTRKMTTQKTGLMGATVGRLNTGSANPFRQ